MAMTLAYDAKVDKFSLDIMIKLQLQLTEFLKVIRCLYFSEKLRFVFLETSKTPAG